MAASRLTLAIGAASGSAPEQEVTGFGTGSLKLSLFAGPTITFGMPGRSPAGLLAAGLESDVWLYRKGAPWQRTRVLPIGEVWSPDGQDDMALSCVGYRQLVEARHIVSGPPTFTAVDQGTIVWNLIQHTQAQTGGDLGITAGTVVTGVTRDRTDYRIGDNLGKLLTDLGKVENGPWWGIDASKVLTAKLFSAFTARIDPLVLGTNARSASRKPGTVGFANAVGAVGSSTATVPEWVASGTVGTDPRGRWEAYDSSHSSVVVQATVTEIANGLLADRENPPYAWTFDVDPAWFFDRGSNYDVGETVPVVIPRPGLPAITATIRVTEVTVAWDDAGTITVTVAGVEV